MNDKIMDKINIILYYVVAPVLVLELLLTDLGIIAFTIPLFAGYLIRVSDSLVWIVLGVTGLAALLYPAPREELMKILVNTLWQIKSYLG